MSHPEPAVAFEGKEDAQSKLASPVPSTEHGATADLPLLVAY